MTLIDKGGAAWRSSSSDPQILIHKHPMQTRPNKFLIAQARTCSFCKFENDINTWDMCSDCKINGGNMKRFEPKEGIAIVNGKYKI